MLLTMLIPFQNERTMLKTPCEYASNRFPTLNANNVGKLCKSITFGCLNLTIAGRRENTYIMKYNQRNKLQIISPSTSQPITFQQIVMDCWL